MLHGVLRGRDYLVPLNHAKVFARKGGRILGDLIRPVAESKAALGPIRLVLRWGDPPAAVVVDRSAPSVDEDAAGGEPSVDEDALSDDSIVAFAERAGKTSEALRDTLTAMSNASKKRRR